MSSLFSLANSFFSRILNLEPDTVIEVKIEEYVHYDIIALEPPLMVHTYTDSKKIQNYEIVLQQNGPTGFSLYRSVDFDKTQEYFNRLKEILPEFANRFPSLLTVSSLQELCKYVNQHPSQKLAHVCAHFGYVEYFQQLQTFQDVMSVINAQDVHGRTPLNIAIETQRSNVIQEILALGPDFRLMDEAGNNVLHFAAQTTGPIVAMLCGAIKNSDQGDLNQLINTKNRNNFTPLYLACFHDKTDCVKELLKNGADVNGASIDQEQPKYPRLDDTNISNDLLISQLSVKDMKNGGTPLHWCRSAEAIEMLSEMNCNLDARNFHGDTALHNMVERGNLNCTIALLSLGADVNAIGANGNTPLHLAVRMNNVTIVQAIIVFGANVDAQNANGETPRHLTATSSSTSPTKATILYILHSVGALRCSAKRPDCAEGCAPEMSYNGVPPENPFSRNVAFYDQVLMQDIVEQRLENTPDKRNKRKRHKLLAMDGGGIRGLILIQILCHLEMITKRRVVDMFDWIAGTSTGGILALLLSSGYTAAECRKIYFRLKDKLFVGRRPYSSDSLERFLRQYLGQEKRMNQLPERPRLFIPALLGDRFPPGSRFFRNYHGPDEILNRRHRDNQTMAATTDECLWKVARATGAAPTYFDPFETYLDGGLIANNPTLDLLTEFQYFNRANEIVESTNEICDIDLVVSLGTGAIPNIPMEIFSLNFSSLFSLSGIGKSFTTIPALLKVLVEQASQTNGCVVDRAQAWCAMISVPFFRLNPPLSEDIQMDETSNVKLINALWETMAYIFLNPEQMAQLLNFLEK